MAACCCGLPSVINFLVADVKRVSLLHKQFQVRHEISCIDSLTFTLNRQEQKVVVSLILCSSVCLLPRWSGLYYYTFSIVVDRNFVLD